MIGKTADNLEFEVILVGAKVRHKKHPELTGTIRCHEWHSPGKYSALPYTIEWDNDRLASNLLGMLNIWPNWENIEEIKEEQ